MNTATTPENEMRLLNNCVIVVVEDGDDDHGPGVKVWDESGRLFLGRFQATGMKIEGVPKREGDPVHDNDTLAMFVDGRHQDSQWSVFRDEMLVRHRVYIPENDYTPNHMRGGLWPILSVGNRWLPYINFTMIAFISWMWWWSGDPITFPVALSVTVLAIFAFYYRHRLIKGRI